MSLTEEINRRRAFAIIAHPDAGKTTLTEKLLLYGGAIQLAGQVKAKREKRSTRSDWMKLEQERGISVSTTALQFSYENSIMNLLDTPGHEDFSEDTYRTLMAVDSAVMLLDGARGVQEQTVKLFRICRERNLPIATFINKLDMPAMHPFELLDSVEEVLGITAAPVLWPMGSGREFKGVYNLVTGKVHRYEKTAHGSYMSPVNVTGLDDPALKELMAEDTYREFREGIDLVSEALPSFNKEDYLAGKITPVFFGSAVTNFGVEILLDFLKQSAPPPVSFRESDGSEIPADDDRFTGFIFKMQANVNRQHRDRVAFMRITSGRFERGMTANVARLDKGVKLASSVAFFGQERSTIDEAYPGDIIGLINPRMFRLGDVLSTGEVPDFHPLPKFAPERFARIVPTDTGKLKAFRKGIHELAEEGVVQVFNLNDATPMVGAVGQLQFDVFKFRLEDEYGAPCRLEPLSFETSRWIHPEDTSLLNRFDKLVEDEHGKPVVLFETEFRLNTFLNENPEARLSLHPDF